LCATTRGVSSSKSIMAGVANTDFILAEDKYGKFLV
jgi:hypothetical protein